MPKPCCLDIFHNHIHNDEIYENLSCLVLTSAPVNLENRIIHILNRIGFPAHIKGFHYTLNAIAVAVESREGVGMVTKVLYPRIAKTFKTTPSRVERAIRHAIEVAWERGDPETLQNIFGHTICNKRGKPTNSEFIAMVSARLRMQLNEKKEQ